MQNNDNDLKKCGYFTGVIKISNSMTSAFKLAHLNYKLNICFPNQSKTGQVYQVLTIRHAFDTLRKIYL